MTTRRDFLSFLALSPAWLLWRPKSNPGSSRQYALNDCFIAGFRFHEGPALLSELDVGDRLKLVPEPENEHDHFAIRIEYDGRHIGYVPRNQNRTVFGLLAQGAPVKCIVTAVDRTAVPWEAVRIRTFLADPAAIASLLKPYGIPGGGTRALVACSNA
jgi:hypothetical protein